MTEASTPGAGGAAAGAREPFPTWRIAVWSLGTMGNSVIGSLAGLMTYFYMPPQTDQSAFPQYLSSATILGLTILGVAGYAGSLVAVFLNPFISAWSDRSRSRIGRRKVFMLVSILPVSILSYLLFQPPLDQVSPVNAVWLLAIVILLNLFRTLFGVWNALIPEFGTSNRIIMLFSTLGNIGWLFGFILGSQAVYMVKDALMATGLPPVEAFRLTVGGMIAIATVFGLLQVAVVDEKRYGTGRTSTIPLLPALKTAFQNRAFVGFTLTNAVYSWSDQLFQMGLIYFVTVVFRLSDSLMILFGGTMAVLSMLVFPLVNLATRRVGKKTLYGTGMVLMIGFMLLFAFGDLLPIPKLTLAWIIVVVLSIPSALTALMPGPINQEIIREDCLRTGQAKEATFGAAGGLINAIPAGLPGLIMPSLLLLGRSPENPTGVRLVAITSAVFALVGFLMLRFLYDEKKVRASLEKFGYK